MDEGSSGTPSGSSGSPDTGSSGLAEAGGHSGTPGGCSGLANPTLESLKDDPALRGTRDLRDLAAYAFSQGTPSQLDSQLIDVAPQMSMRTTNQWETDGTRVTHYRKSNIEALEQAGIIPILGLTATVFFRAQTESDEAFLDLISRDASGNVVPRTNIEAGAHRGNIANPAFRRYVIDVAKTLIDAGAGGIFFDEANAGYEGVEYDGNEGFDAYHGADFNRFLCGKYPDLTRETFAERFDTTPEDALDCQAIVCGQTGSFDYVRYLAAHDWQANPLTKANPLAAEWGSSVANRPETDGKTFLGTYPALVYWADMVREVRAYAREKYQKEILITSNGLFPFVDFQSIGLYNYNRDGENHSEAPYVPVTKDGKLDGAVSLLPVFTRLRERSVQLAGDVPVVLFIDWPTKMMSSYYKFTRQEREDYFRIYLAEAHAAGLRFALHLKTSIYDDPTATSQKMMPFFKEQAAFLREHAALFASAEPAAVQPVLSNDQVTSSMMRLPDGRFVVHLINHDYADGVRPQTALEVSLALDPSGATAQALSPQWAEPRDLPLSGDSSSTRFTLDELPASALVVITPR